MIVIPVGETFTKYATQLEVQLKKAGFRVRGDYSTDGLNKKVRNAEKMHVNYILVVGEEEEKNQSVSVRNYKTKEQTVLPVEEYIALMQEELQTKAL